ncbi:serine hydrolase domain-containing protein [Heyndrickxia acidicola]|uniref:Serine hydrolase n=1 Tax=Heyndrickxia acidicola TaxID=209389 RepID=A0ABU6MG82_9BACI|nr:serine hydrolase domain-containing protein [Heyndrickxia acidicola]MED1202277.1 serine hydrolase [Heyndrickxia acidicola]
MQRFLKTGSIAFMSSALFISSTGFYASSSDTVKAKDGYYSRFTWDHPGKSSSVLYKGTAREAGMVDDPLRGIDPIMKNAIEQKVMPGAVTLIARKGIIVQNQAYGYAYKYTDDQFTEAENPVLMRKNTIFDIASISKLFTTVAVMQLYDKGLFKLDDPVAKYLPEFAENGKQAVTIRQLLTHTSGFEPDIPLYQMPGTREERIEMVLKHGLAHPPGTNYTYSDLNMITLGALVERLTGQREDVYVKQHITDPLNMKDTMYNPGASLKPRVAATEYQPWTGRGLVWGQVHDENAWALDGVAGHAGVFSTAHDLAILGQTFLNGGEYGHSRILKAATVKLMEQNMNQGFPGDDHGLGFELNQGWYMDSLSDEGTLGHTGFTGTSLVISPQNQTIVILLTNRVHPTRNTVSTNQTRRLVARQAGDAIPVEIRGNSRAWFAGYGDNKKADLEAKVDIDTPSMLTFKTWYRIEKDADFGRVEVSEDGAVWSKLGPDLTGSSDQWERISYPLPVGTKYIRFEYETDSSVNGRGWYVLSPAILSKGKNQPLECTTSDWELRSR